MRLLVKCVLFAAFLTIGFISSATSAGRDAEMFAGGLLQPIAVAEPMPSYTVGMYTRIDPPLTSAAAAMVKAVTLVARNLARSA